MNACSLNYQSVRINADAREVHSNKVHATRWIGRDRNSRWRKIANAIE